MLPCASAAGSNNAAVVSNVLGDVGEYLSRELVSMVLGTT
jgi:hypothetical protein